MCHIRSEGSQYLIKYHYRTNNFTVLETLFDEWLDEEYQEKAAGKMYSLLMDWFPGLEECLTEDFTVKKELTEDIQYKIVNNMVKRIKESNPKYDEKSLTHFILHMNKNILKNPQPEGGLRYVISAHKSYSDPKGMAFPRSVFSILHLRNLIPFNIYWASKTIPNIKMCGDPQK